MSKEKSADQEPSCYLEWLCSIPGLYHAHREALLRCFGTAKAVWEAPSSEFAHLRQRGNLWVEKAEVFRERMTPEQTVHERAAKGIQFISCESEAYPKRMRPLAGMPYGLFVAGILPPEEKRAVAIVGARMCTRDGKGNAQQLARRIVQADGVIISGGAYGIDGIAQQEALKAGGRSYALLGCGADRIYPKEHAPLFDLLRSQGGLISEFPPGTAPLPFHFPMRNRLISALADVVVVVEAKKQSGSLITAGFAAEQGRPVMAVPGRLGDELSEGCNELIAQGAGLILSAQAFTAEFFPDFARRKMEKSEQIALAPAEKLVYSSLGLHAKSVWELEEGTSLSLAALGAALLALEQKGLVRETDRNFYVKVK